MSEGDRAIVRASLLRIELGMAEAREVLQWWRTLGEVPRQDWKDLAAAVGAYRKWL